MKTKRITNLDEKIQEIQIARNIITATEKQYQGKVKGAIFQNTVQYNKRKIKALIQEIDDLGRGELITWDIQVKDLTTGRNKWIDVTVDVSITEQDIKKRLLLSELEVFYIKPQKQHIITGFPRITVK